MLQTDVIKHRCDLKIPRRALGSSQIARIAERRQAGNAAGDSPFHSPGPGWAGQDRHSRHSRGPAACWGHLGATRLQDGPSPPCSALCPLLAVRLQTLLSLEDPSCSRWSCQGQLVFVFSFLLLLLLPEEQAVWLASRLLFLRNSGPFTPVGGEWQREFSVASREGSEATPACIKTPLLGQVCSRETEEWGSVGPSVKNERWEEMDFVSVSSLCVVLSLSFHHFLVSPSPKSPGSVVPISQKRTHAGGLWGRQVRR